MPWRMRGWFVRTAVREEGQVDAVVGWPGARNEAHIEGWDFRVALDWGGTGGHDSLSAIVDRKRVRRRKFEHVRV